MPAHLVAEEVLIVALAALLLYSLSRALFVWAVQALAANRPGGGRLLQLLRLPGNLVHETSHAIGYLLCGYRVKELVPCTRDSNGRGVCRPGKAWSPVALPWLATGVAALAPLVVGTLVLRLLASALGIRMIVWDTAREDGTILLLIDSVVGTLRALDFHDWRTYVFLASAFSIGAELAPSDVDLKRSLAPIATVVIGLMGTIYYLGVLHPDSPAWAWLGGSLSRGLGYLFSLLVFGILTTAVVGALVIGPVVLLRAARSATSASSRAERRR